MLRGQRGTDRPAVSTDIRHSGTERRDRWILSEGKEAIRTERPLTPEGLTPEGGQQWVRKGATGAARIPSPRSCGERVRVRGGRLFELCPKAFRVLRSTVCQG